MTYLNNYKRMAVAALIGAAAVFASCEKKQEAAPKPPMVRVHSVVLQPDTATLRLGTPRTLVAVVRDSIGQELLARPLTWTTSDAGVAGVDRGVVTGQALGTATITVSCEGKVARATVWVKPVVVASVRILTDSVRINSGLTVQLQAVALDAAGRPLTGRPITWQSSSGATATVSGSGLVTAAGAGTATITATSGTRSGSAHVRVYARLPLYNYVSFQNVASVLQPWAGQRVVLLTPEQNLDPRIMQRIVGSLDGGYDYYRQVTGREPARHPTYTYQGKATIASVAQTCGGACGQLGYTGIEMIHPWVTELYDDVRLRGQHHATFFYELGRNFWFYSPQLYYSSGMRMDVATGYAELMKHMATDYLRLPLRPLEASMRQGLDNVAATYLNTPGWDWSRAVTTGEAPNASGSPHASHLLFAGMLLRLQSQYGRHLFMERFWQEAGRRTQTTSVQHAIDNLALATCAGANANLTRVLSTQWRMVVSGGAQAEAQTRFGNPI
ncbi:Ig domain-containing protein [Hymenobacter sp. B81]|uniref:Ig domain-containing protein n=1 Tax=Hymenobacter sp. B81 TaxID=3344878 RepID=UPI0037DD2CDB